MTSTPVENPAADWDFRGHNTQYGTHGIHTYVAAMIPPLARRLVEEYIPKGGTVLDPFCGGGAVLVESVASGRDAIGRDVNPLAILISKAKTSHVDQLEAESTLKRIVTTTKPATTLPLIDPVLAYWFKPEHLGTLHGLRAAINESTAEGPIATLFSAVFSATVRDVSLTYRNEVRLRRMTLEEIAKFDVNPVTRFRARATRAIMVASELPNANVDIKEGTAQSIALENDACDGIVCSPPYGDERNGVSYVQFAKNMLAWLGYSNDAVRQSKTQTLGWGSMERTLPPSQTLADAVDAIAGFPDSVKAATAFYADYLDALKEMARVVRSSVVIVIGQRVLRDTVFDNGAITSELMRSIGLQQSYAGYRQLPTKRLPKMRAFGAAIDREAILVFQK